MRIIAIDLFTTHKRMLYFTLPKLSLIKDTSLNVYLLTLPGKLIPKIESLASRPFGIDEPAPIPFLPTSVYPRPFTPPIPPNLPTHSESSSPSSLLTLLK